MITTFIKTNTNIDIAVQREGKSKRSKGEEIVSFVLDTLQIPYVEEHEIETDGRFLRYDFYSKQLKMAIEVQGIQHFKWIEFFQPTYEDFLAQQENDESKRNYSRNHGISLLEIPYTDINNVRQLVNKFIGEQAYV